jgi:uncharacterized coiled-coil DUF342 family protein
MSGDETGRTLAAIQSLEKTVSLLINTWAEQDRNASAGRKDLYEKVNEMREELVRIAERIVPIAELRAEMKAMNDKIGPVITEVGRLTPIVNKLDRSYTQGSGVAGVGRIVLAVFGTGVGAVILKKIGWL